MPNKPIKSRGKNLHQVYDPAGPWHYYNCVRCCDGAAVKVYDPYCAMCHDNPMGTWAQDEYITYSGGDCATVGGCCAKITGEGLDGAMAGDSYSLAYYGQGFGDCDDAINGQWVTMGGTEVDCDCEGGTGTTSPPTTSPPPANCSYSVLFQLSWNCGSTTTGPPPPPPTTTLPPEGKCNYSVEFKLSWPCGSTTAPPTTTPPPTTIPPTTTTCPPKFKGAVIRPCGPRENGGGGGGGDGGDGPEGGGGGGEGSTIRTGHKIMGGEGLAHTIGDEAIGPWHYYTCEKCCGGGTLKVYDPYCAMCHNQWAIPFGNAGIQTNSYITYTGPGGNGCCKILQEHSDGGQHEHVVAYYGQGWTSCEDACSDTPPVGHPGHDPTLPTSQWETLGGDIITCDDDSNANPPPPKPPCDCDDIRQRKPGDCPECIPCEDATTTTGGPGDPPLPMEDGCPPWPDEQPDGQPNLDWPWGGGRWNYYRIVECWPHQDCEYYTKECKWTDQVGCLDNQACNHGLFNIGGTGVNEDIRCGSAYPVTEAEYDGVPEGAEGAYATNRYTDICGDWTFYSCLWTGWNVSDCCDYTTIKCTDQIGGVMPWDAVPESCPAGQNVGSMPGHENHSHYQSSNMRQNLHYKTTTTSIP